MLEFLKNYKLFVLAVFLVFDLVAAVFYFVDKKKAVTHKWRIPEKTLLALAIPGGIGARAAMAIFHHKTQKWNFRVWDGLFAIAQIAVLILAFI